MVSDGSGFGPATMSPSDGGEEQRPSAQMQTARDNLLRGGLRRRQRPRTNRERHARTSRQRACRRSQWLEPAGVRAERATADAGVGVWLRVHRICFVHEGIAIERRPRLDASRLQPRADGHRPTRDATVDSAAEAMAALARCRGGRAYAAAAPIATKQSALNIRVS
jgi:hypothetical protein